MLAVCVHAILFVGLFVVFQWNTESDDVVYAELWAPSQMSNVSQIAPETPKEPEEEKAEPEPKPEPEEEQKEPEPKPEPKPEPQPEPQKAQEQEVEQPDQDVIRQQEEEKKKLEEQKKLLEQQRLEEQRKAEEQKRLEEEKRAAEEKQRQEAQQRRREQARKLAQQMRSEQLKDLQASSRQNVAGVTVQAGGPQSAFYSSRIIACIRPNIAFAVPPNTKAGRYRAVYEVRLSGNGQPEGAPRLVRASGLPGFDRAVERAIQACNPFPNHPTGTPPRTIQLTFDPVDNKR